VKPVATKEVLPPPLPATEAPPTLEGPEVDGAGTGGTGRTRGGSVTVLGMGGLPVTEDVEPHLE
jgi:hypothetical protein